jgi:glycosyltransferase involved in cell wall biosynthesis
MTKDSSGSTPYRTDTQYLTPPLAYCFTQALGRIKRQTQLVTGSSLAGANGGVDMVESDVRSKLKLIYFSYFPAQHAIGPATAIRNLARQFQTQYEVSIIALNFDYSLRKKIFSVKLHEVRDGAIRIIYLPKSILGLKRLFQEIKEDKTCIVVNCMFDQVLAIPAIIYARIRRQTIVHVPHGIFLPAVFKHKNLKKRIFCYFFDVFGLGKSVVHIATSQREAKDIRNALKRPAIVQISNLNALSEEIQPRSKPPDSLNICFIGRIAKQKNLLGALEILQHANLNCTMDVFGIEEDAAYVARCKTLIATFPASINVSFQGFTPQDVLLRRIASYDLLFAPTLDENYGYSIIESMGAGVPVLISDRTPWRDLEKFKAGWVVELENWIKFSEILNLAYHSGEEWANYRSGARNYAHAHTMQTGAPERYKMLFEAILASWGKPFRLPPALIGEEPGPILRE